VFTMEKKAILPDAKTFGKRLYGLIAPEIVHPATREQGVSFNRREQMRRNNARYGKRQITIIVSTSGIAIHRNAHMPMPERKKPEYKPLAYLEHYRTSLMSSGYRLLDGMPNSLIFQYEGRLH
jgi:hypothetical protein